MFKKIYVFIKNIFKSEELYDPELNAKYVRQIPYEQHLKDIEEGRVIEVGKK